MLTAMVWATTVLFASLSAATVPASRLASTYDEAACAEEAAAEEALLLPSPSLDPEADCRPPAPVPPPAVIDCNDDREGGFVADMIGSCDMPRAAGAPSLLRTQAAPAPKRICDGIHCTDESSPLRPASRGGDEDQSAASATLSLPRWDEVSALEARTDSVHSILFARRIERPPRNFR